MRRGAALLAALAASLVLTSTAAAAYAYAGPKQWAPGMGAGTGFSSGWLANNFQTYGGGTDKSVTFIDNRTYSWHNTRRGTSDYLETYPPLSGTFKAHCVAHAYFWGSCNVR